MNTDRALAALAALAQASRLAIYRLLVVAGEPGLAAGKIGAELGLPPATLSFHLKELAHAELVIATQVGKFVYYRADYARMKQLMGYLTEHCCADSGGACEVPDLSRPPVAVALPLPVARRSRQAAAADAGSRPAHATRPAHPGVSDD